MEPVDLRISNLKSLAGLAVIALGLSFQATPAEAREVVALKGAFKPGTIVVSTKKRSLFFVLGGGKAIMYPVAVGTPENQWGGESYVSLKRPNPGWSPTPSMRRKNPRLPRYVPPGPRNPLGRRALNLGWSMYRIHGTPKRHSIGRAASNGCIRMLNEDVLDLYERVHVGAPVIVLR